MAPGRRPQHQQLCGPLVDAHNRILILVVAPLCRKGVELHRAWRSPGNSAAVLSSESVTG